MRLAIIAIAVLLACWALLALGTQAAIAESSARQVLAESQLEDAVPVLVTTWKYQPEPDGPCLTHSVSTTMQPRESPEEHAARHHLSVRTALVEFPAAPASNCP